MGEPLSSDDIAVLEHLLRGGDPIRDTLRAQIPYAYVASHCGCGCATANLALVDGAVASAVDPARHPVVADADIVLPDGSVPGGVMVFAYDGFLTRLEIYDWLDDGPPFSRWPSLENLKIGR